MKTKIMTVVCAAAIGLASTSSAVASPEADPAVVAGDALIVRPLSFVATVIGAAVFVVSLPVAATSRSVNSAADALVVAPAQFTFTRRLGDFDYYSDPAMAAKSAGRRKVATHRHPKPEKWGN